MSMSTDDAVGALLFGCTLIDTDQHGLAVDATRCGPEDLHTIGTASTLVYRLVSKSDTIAEMSQSRLAVMTASLLVAPRGPDGGRIAREWRQAWDEYLQIRDGSH